MIEHKTVLVLGAGASKPFGFPIGLDLKEEILITLKEKRNKILEGLGNPNLIRSFIDKLSIAPEYSIDAFLETQSDPVIIDFGKLAIAAILLPHEQEKFLFNNYQGRGEEKEYFNWYRHLWNEMKTSFDDFEKNLSIITFNYDRSLEHFLYRVLKQKNPGKKDEEYKKKLGNIPIIHVYGKLGYLPWDCPEEERPVPYDYNWDYIDRDCVRICEQEEFIENAASKIQIIHENEKIKDEELIRLTLKNTKRIYFLGFGFNQINMDRILGDIKRSDCEIKGTIYKMSLKSKNIAQKRLHTFKNHDRWRFFDHFYTDTTIYDLLYNRVIL
ncbi:MAG: hypothetical protein JSW40_09925 [Candidatus Omnitrophota bacterium]|nr:MAG: hypothetical protein JSW40_09925 [Candidatus Omnitrophota bacterium]